ncbi:hypothetical protein [Caulobacter hibisci]|uniref:Uncharacterized protein n=1 Tax=Caulobacter hibisci TaxID=2035993 RepID=A0ABS0T073_9CAUL|nr:hypothetical protein [Caulobacter hibisci]MBI1684247.1 hypothetical protein [Caulobacter hibisci]
MRKSVLAAAGMTATALFIAFAPAAEAGQHGRTVHVQGAYGRSYAHDRHVSRQPGAVSVSRGTQTNGGYGVASQRGANWGDGVYSGGASRTFNNGASASRATSVVDNHDGTYSYSHSRTGYDGDTRSVSGVVSRP